MKSEKEKFMTLALKEADKAEQKEEVPIGCVIVKDGKVVAKAHNLKQTKRLATAHAEVLAIEKACRKLKDWRLEDYEIYVTLEPTVTICAVFPILSKSLSTKSATTAGTHATTTLSHIFHIEGFETTLPFKTVLPSAIVSSCFSVPNGKILFQNITITAIIAPSWIR